MAETYQLTGSCRPIKLLPRILKTNRNPEEEEVQSEVQRAFVTLKTRMVRQYNFQRVKSSSYAIYERFLKIKVLTLYLVLLT